MTEDADPKQHIGYILLARILSLLVIASLIVVHDAVDRVEFQWHQKAAWWILTISEPLSGFAPRTVQRS